LAARTPPITNMLFDVGDFPLVSRNLVQDGVAWGYGPRRTTLDKILIDAAVESGAEFREGFNVNEFVFDGGVMVGIRGRGASGPLEDRATITVGADGRNSKLARSVDAQVYNEAPALLCYYFSYWSGVEAEQFELYARSDQRRVIFSFKTEDDLFAVFVGLPMEELQEIRRDIEREFMRTLDIIPGLRARVSAGHREERFYGATDLPNFYRKPYGAGWALIGDAGLHKDPFLALGICDAFRDVALMAEAIREGLSSTRSINEAMADFEVRRNNASAADYNENLAAARFTPPAPQFLAVRAAVRNNPQEATRLIKARMGMIDPVEFFNPQNLQRLLGVRT
jgi:flavin-dependent dehydrogenase